MFSISTLWLFLNHSFALNMKLFYARQQKNTFWYGVEYTFDGLMMDFFSQKLISIIASGFMVFTYLQYGGLAFSHDYSRL